MGKRYVRECEKELTRLFEKRTRWLREIIRNGGRGLPPKWIKRTEISKAVKKVQDLATQNLSKTFAKEAFDETVNQKKQWQVSTSKGWGRDKKKKNFDKWFEKNIHFSNCIYIFWSKKKCIYVGKTLKGKGRPQSHFIKHWFSQVTRIDVFSTKKASYIPKLECLAIHRFRPTKNGIKASIPKWAKRCPVCETQKAINNDMRNIYSCKK